MSRIEELSPDQALKYFKSRLQRNPRRTNNEFEYRVSCPWHDDRSPSLQLNTAKKTFHCFSCGREGGLLKFEMELMGGDKQTSLLRIGEIVGDNLLKFAQVEPDFTWDYVDEDGKLLYQVLRYNPVNGGRKRLSQRRPGPDGGWIYDLDGARRVLYRLPDVLTARHICITEGEKDCDLLRPVVGTLTESGPQVAVTTNPGGAGKWNDTYSIYFAGKEAVIFADNDPPDKKGKLIGQRHAENVALSLWPYTRKIKIVAPPAPYHDIGDYIEAMKAGKERDVLELIREADWWSPPDQAHGYFVGVDTFQSIAPLNVDWMVEGLIERGSNGVLIAMPKAGKSWLAADLALHLATGRTWFGFDIPRRVKVALAAREDNPMLTNRRIAWLRNMMPKENLDEWFYVNTKRQKSRVMLDDSEQLDELIHNIKTRGIEFLILDVLNRLHGADENDNTEMRSVLDRVDTITSETGCSVCLIHHTSKADDSNATVIAGSRGASSIAGFAEFAGRVDVVDVDGRVRRLRWDSKSQEEIDSLYWKIESNDREHWARLQVLHDYEPPEKQNGRNGYGRH